MAKLFGDTDDIVVYADDIHVDHNTHELVVSDHDKTGLHGTGTDAASPGGQTTNAKPKSETNQVENSRRSLV